MAQANINSIAINKSDIQTLTDVIEVVIQNYCSEDITFTYRSVSRIIPKANGNIPSSFRMNAQGLSFNVEFEIVIPSDTVTKRVIIDYTTKLNC